MHYIKQNPWVCSEYFQPNLLLPIKHVFSSVKRNRLIQSSSMIGVIYWPRHLSPKLTPASGTYIYVQKIQGIENTFSPWCNQWKGYLDISTASGLLHRFLQCDGRAAKLSGSESGCGAEKRASMVSGVGAMACRSQSLHCRLTMMFA